MEQGARKNVRCRQASVVVHRYIDPLACTGRSCTSRYHSELIKPPHNVDVVKQACGPAGAVVYIEPA